VGTQTFVFAGLLIELAADMGISVAVAGYLAAAYALTYAFTAPFIALRTRQLERRRLLWVSLLILGVINLAAAMASTFTELISLRILAGLGATLVTPVVPAVVASLLPPERRGPALAMVMGGMVLAFMFGMPLGSLIGAQFGWRSTFILAAALCLGAALAIRLVLPRVTSQDQSGWRLLALGWLPPVRRLLIMTLTSFCATFCVVPFIAPVMKIIIGSTEWVAFSQMLVGVGALCGVVIAGKLGTPSNPGRVLKRAFVIVAATQILYSLSMNWLPGQGVISWLGLSFAVVFGASALFFMTPLVQAQLLEAAPHARQVTLALNGSMMFLGQGAGAALGAQVTQAFSMPMIGLAGASMAMIGWYCARRLQANPVSLPSQSVA
tara:strand:- start:241 stop:1380 length:1140 start_codon:yes stop_codon:yes gene_type:complete